MNQQKRTSVLWSIILQGTIIISSLMITSNCAVGVEDYEAVLGYMTSGGEKKWVEEKFNLPQDCEAMKQYANLHFGSFDMTRVRRYSSFSLYCQKNEILGNGDREAIHDFVSDYDFSSLALSLVPYSMHCTGVTSNDWFEFCDKVRNKSQEICKPKPCSYPLSYLEFILGESEWSWYVRTDYSSFDENSCRLKDGAFTGRLTIIDGEIHCVHAKKEELEDKSLTLKWVEFRDMNHDGFMDAVLKITQRADGSAPDQSSIFFLTRLSDQGKMKVLKENSN